MSMVNVNKEGHTRLKMKIIQGKPVYVQKQYKHVAKEFDMLITDLNGNSEMALIQNARYGLDDRGIVSLRLEIMKNNSIGTTNVLDVETAVDFITDYAVKDVKDLIGKPIKMVSHVNRMMWIEPIKIKLGKK